MNNLQFYGIDASNEISLLEYGLLVSTEKHEDGSGTQFCVYQINEDAYGTGHYSEQEINNLLKGNDWMGKDDVNSFLSYVGTDINEYLEINLANKLYDLKSYFGVENIFGSDYYPLTESEVIAKYLS